MYLTSDMQKSRWWGKPRGDERAAAVASAAERMWSIQNSRRMGFEHCARLYGDAQALSLSPWAYSQQALQYEGPTASLNVVRSIVDTYVSNTVQVKVRPMFLTNKGSWDDRQRALDLQKFVDGALAISRFQDIENLLLRDAGVFGQYVVHWYAQKDAKGRWQPRAMRLLPHELLFDDVDSFHGTPTCTTWRKLVDRSRLRAMFPMFKDRINSLNNAASESGAMGAENSTYADLVEVFESWHPPSAPGADDGAHVIAAGDIDLTDKDDDVFEDEAAPFTRFYYDMPQVGVYGSGVAEQLTGIQYELNRMMLNFSDAEKLISVQRIFLPNGSQMLKSEFTDEIGTLIRTSGDPPFVPSWPMYSQDVFAHFRFLYEQAYALMGYSMQDAQAVKPDGLNSGAAQRAFADITSKRHTERLRRREAAVLDGCKQLVSLFKRIAAADPDFSITFKDKTGLERIRWADVDMDSDSYEMQVFPSSMLPLEPGARIQTVNELTDRGYVTRNEARALIDLPDFSAVNAMNVAPYDLIMTRLTEMLKTQRYMPPDGIMDLQLALQLGSKFIQREEVDGASDEKLEVIRRFLTDTERMLSQKAAAPQTGGGAPPQIMPGMPPQGAAPPIPMPPGMPPQGPPPPMPM